MDIKQELGVSETWEEKYKNVILCSDDVGDNKGETKKQEETKSKTPMHCKPGPSESSHERIRKL